jgi:hypothetical protein
MALIDWPPEFDGIKLTGHTIFGRVKNTDIWIELNSHIEWLQTISSKEMRATIQAWLESVDHL